jgi:hypothetical protein
VANPFSTRFFAQAGGQTLVYAAPGVTNVLRCLTVYNADSGSGHTWWVQLEPGDLYIAGGVEGPSNPASGSAVARALDLRVVFHGGESLRCFTGPSVFLTGSGYKFDS